MGIKGLMSLLKSDAPESFRVIKKTTSKDNSKKPFYGKVIAIDASISLYQFLVQIRTGAGPETLLTDSEGNITSHIQGFLTRTVYMLEQGIIPVYVFDGKPPVLKKGTLDHRKVLKEKAQKNVEGAKELLAGNEYSEAEGLAAENTVRMESKRIVHVSKEQNNDIKTLLSLMGIPVITAPEEAEAQCAELVRSGLCYAAATEDMDALAFGCPRILRGLNADTKEPVTEIILGLVVKDLGLDTFEEFLDLCILCGCDYCPNIKGIGPKTALSLVLKHKNIETILKNLSPRFVPDDNYMALVRESRTLFNCIGVIKSKDIGSKGVKRSKVDEKGLYEYLVSKNFSGARVTKIIERIKESETPSGQRSLMSIMGKA